MVRTTSAKLRRSFAQLAEAGSTRLTQRYAPPFILAVAVLQAMVLIAQVAAFTLPAPLLHSDAIQLVSVLTLLSACYLAYVMFAQVSGQEPSASDDTTTAVPRQAAPTLAQLSKARTCSSSDAEQLMRIKSRVSHELRTPLNAVIGFSEMMQQEVLGPVGNERYREYAAQIRQSAEHFQRATEKTLAVAELLTSPPKRLRETIRLADLVEGSLETFRKTTGTTEPAWRVHIDRGFLIEGNRSALADALHHLWGAGRHFAVVARLGEQASCAVTCTQATYGYADLQFEIDSCNGVMLEMDTELTPGAELNLMLARLGVEAAGGVLTIEQPTQTTWSAAVRMPLATQREFQLH